MSISGPVVFSSRVDFDIVIGEQNFPKEDMLYPPDRGGSPEQFCSPDFEIQTQPCLSLEGDKRFDFRVFYWEKRESWGGFIRR